METSAPRLMLHSRCAGLLSRRTATHCLIRLLLLDVCCLLFSQYRSGQISSGRLPIAVAMAVSTRSDLRNPWQTQVTVARETESWRAIDASDIPRERSSLLIFLCKSKSGLVTIC